jgi:hydroxymethylpyrimidine pyrophosphatase-like HAD family hydrolase
VDKAIMEEIWVWAEHFHLPVQTYVPQGIRVNYNNPWTRLDSELTGLEWRLMNRTEFMSETRAKIILPGEPTTLDKVEAHFKEVFSGRANMCRSKPYFFEIMHPVADKGLALERVSAWQGIPREDVMAIGDSWNDRGMLLWAGMGIAMANGEAGIRRIADWVTTRMHHEDGVAEAIDRFILNPGSRQGVRIID